MTTPDLTESADPPADAALRAQVRQLADRAEVVAVLDQYVRHLDYDRGSDAWLDVVFTQDAEVTLPMARYRGLAGLREFQAMARTTFERTHHLSSNHQVALHGDRAVVTGHLTAVHVWRAADPGDHFAIGGHYDAEVVRTVAGWRIGHFVFDLVWRSGRPPAGDVGG